VVKGLEGQGVATSICANQIDTPRAPDFGYRPNVRAIIDAVKPTLVP
jgi:hypothetical protein